MLVVAENPAEDPAAVLKRRLTNAEIIWRSKAGSLVRLTRKIQVDGESLTLTGKVLVVPAANNQLFVALAIESPKFASRVLRPLIERCSPRIFLPRLTSKSVAAVLRHAANAQGIEDFEITDVSARSRMEHKRGKRIRSERMRTGETLEEALTLLHERGQWLHSAAFNYGIKTNKRRLRCAGRISRESCFTVVGDFAWFYRNVIRPAEDEAVTGLKFYADRARKETPDNVPKPIVIEYPEPIFSDTSKNRRLAQSLKRLKRLSVSILHANPYFRSSIVDFTDGSSYEVWVLSQSRIIVTPQFRATSASMERIIDHILTDFGEGELKDFGEAFNE